MAKFEETFHLFLLHLFYLLSCVPNSSGSILSCTALNLTVSPSNRKQQAQREKQEKVRNVPLYFAIRGYIIEAVPCFSKQKKPDFFIYLAFDIQYQYILLASVYLSLAFSMSLWHLNTRYLILMWYCQIQVFKNHVIGLKKNVFLK